MVDTATRQIEAFAAGEPDSLVPESELTEALRGRAVTREQMFKAVLAGSNLQAACLMYEIIDAKIKSFETDTITRINLRKAEQMALDCVRHKSKKDSDGPLLDSG